MMMDVCMDMSCVGTVSFVQKIRSVDVFLCHCFFFFFNDSATTEIYTLSLHDALPICTTHITTRMVDH